MNATLCSFYEDDTNDNAFFLVRAIMEACRDAMLNHSGDSANMVKPALAVPDELVEEPGTWKTPDVVFGWNECRAAMLAQPVSQGYRLPEGFKLMPIEITDEIAEAIAMEARCCGGIALCIYEAALAAAPDSN